MTAHFWRWLFALVVMLTAIAGLYLAGWTYQLLHAGGSIVALYFAAWLLQFFCTPIVDFLTCRGIGRFVAVTIVYVGLAIIIAIVLVVSVPNAIAQGTHLANQLSQPGTYVIISNFTRGIEQFAETRLHVPHAQVADFTRNYSFSLQNGAVKAGAKLQQIIHDRLMPGNLSSSASTFLTFLNAINTLLLDLVIVAILAFYMMLDGHKLVRQVLDYFPPAASEVIDGIHVIIINKFGGYLRGQIILALTYGWLTFLIAIGFGIQYPIVVGAFASIMMLVPFVGTVAAIVPPLVGFTLAHAADKHFPVIGLVALFFLLAVAQHFVINLLAPRVMGTAMGMHPLVVMLGLLLGARFAGLWGAIFGVPLFGTFLDSLDLIYRRVMERRFGFQPPTAAQMAADEQHPPPKAGAPSGRRRMPGASGAAVRRTMAILRSIRARSKQPRHEPR